MQQLMIFFVHALVYIVYSAYVYIYTNVAVEQKPAVSPVLGVWPYVCLCVLCICVHAHTCICVCLCVREADALQADQADKYRFRQKQKPINIGTIQSESRQSSAVSLLLAFCVIKEQLTLTEGMTLLAPSKQSEKVSKLPSNMSSNCDRRFTISNNLLNASHFVVSSEVKAQHL